MNRKRIAIVGGGIAGLSAAWLLRHKYDVVLFEGNDYLGGHTHTVEVNAPSGPVGIDTGFVVYNNRNYPLLTKLFDWLRVESQRTDMSFAASIDGGSTEYAGSNLNTLFGQRRNITSLRFLSMVRDILRFNREGKLDLANGLDIGVTMGEYLELGRYGSPFREHYLLPMAAAIWSCPIHTMMQFPARSLLQFFNNHGLLELAERPQWKTVVGGSREYVKRMKRALGASARVDQAIVGVRRSASSVLVRVQGGKVEHFDEVVFATHADTTLKLLENPTPPEQSLLRCFRYQPNRTILHGDPSLMPVSKRVWSSWNYLAQSRKQKTHSVSVTYWMNNLQRLDTQQQYFVSLNPLKAPNTQSIIAEFSYDHPVFDTSAVEAQTRFEQIQGVDRVWFTGSYLGYGFHEDALRASIAVAHRLDVEPPWASGDSERAVTPIAYVAKEAMGT